MKRQAPSAAPAHDTKKPCPEPEPSRAPSAPTLLSLHTDLLVEIFAYAPFRARMRTIGLVCKRFRTAALRSIDSLVLPDARIRGPYATAISASLLQLFSNLKALHIEASSMVPFVPLPPALRELHLGSL